jgi:hypothetical protein
MIWFVVPLGSKDWTFLLLKRLDDESRWEYAYLD